MKETQEKKAGRIGRKQYLNRCLILIAIGIAVGIGQGLAETVLPAQLSGALRLLVGALYGLPALALSVVWTMHRAVDAGKDEAWGFLMMVPFVNILALVVFASMPSMEDAHAG